MNTNFTKSIVIMTLVCFAGVAHAQQQREERELPVAVKTDGMPSFMAEKVKEKAAQGSTELRRYVDRTRMVHSIDFRSILRDDGKPNLTLNTKTEEPTKVAGAAPAAR